MENGKWEMEDGRWEMEDGRWKMVENKKSIIRAGFNFNCRQNGYEQGKMDQ
jgi:hypothetical protein